MKVVNIISSHFFPENSAGANRLSVVVDTIAKEHLVNVIFLYNRGSKVDFELLRERFGENINLYPIYQRDFNSSKFLNRIFFETYYSLLLNIKNLNLKSDISIFTTPYLMVIPVSGIFKLFSKRYSIMEVRDLIWLYLDFSESRVLNYLKRVLERVTLFSLAKFQKVITVTNSQREYIENRGVKAIEVIENGIGFEKFLELKELKLEPDSSKFIISYVGTVGFPQDLTTLIESAKLLKDERDIEFWIVGKGNNIEIVKRLIREYNLESVKLFGEANWEEVKKFYQKSNILYAQLRDRESFRTAQPSKIFEYASTGLPIIYAGVGESESLISKLKDSILIEPNSPEQLKRAILELKSQAIESKLFENIDYIEKNYIREREIKRYLEIIKGIDL